MPSSAYTAFKDSNLEQVNKLIALYDSELARNNKAGKRSLDHITRSALMFLCSSFEIYIESVIQESCEIISKKMRTPSELPKQVKHTIANHIRENNNEFSPIIFASDWKSYYLDMVRSELEKLNTPKISKIEGLISKYIGLNNKLDKLSFPFVAIDDIVTERGEVAHKLYGKAYLRRDKIIEYCDTVKAAVKELDLMLYDNLPMLVSKKPWNNTY